MIKYTCDLCDKSFTRQEYLKAHSLRCQRPEDNLKHISNKSKRYFYMLKAGENEYCSPTKELLKIVNFN